MGLRVCWCLLAWSLEGWIWRNSLLVEHDLTLFQGDETYITTCCTSRFCCHGVLRNCHVAFVMQLCIKYSVVQCWLWMNIRSETVADQYWRGFLLNNVKHLNSINFWPSSCLFFFVWYLFMFSVAGISPTKTIRLRLVSSYQLLTEECILIIIIIMIVTMMLNIIIIISSIVVITIIYIYIDP